MNGSLATNAYTTLQRDVQTPRGLELQVFTRINGRLRAAAQQGKIDFRALVSALHENRKLWDVISIDLADTANAYPDELKAQLIYLGEFTRQHTHKVLSGDDTADAIIDINSAIINGLRGKPEPMETT
jgi:flagellar protein FlaF